MTHNLKQKARTFPITLSDDDRGSWPLNVSQTRHPRPHMSKDLQLRVNIRLLCENNAIEQVQVIVYESKANTKGLYENTSWFLLSQTQGDYAKTMHLSKHKVIMRKLQFIYIIISALALPNTPTRLPGVTFLTLRRRIVPFRGFVFFETRGALYWGYIAAFSLARIHEIDATWNIIVALQRTTSNIWSQIPSMC